MPTPSTLESKQADSVERRVLERLRVAYEALHETSVLIEQNKNVLRRCGSPLADMTSYGPSAHDALKAIDVMGGQLHAQREVAFPGDDACYEAMESYLNALDEARMKWMDGAYYVTMSRPLRAF